MQFSVIVEAPQTEIIATEDSVAELERYLLSAKISPDVLKKIEPGKSHVLKNELSYAQAVDLSDRLMDFGLESIIHPPTKPEDEMKSNADSNESANKNTSAQTIQNTEPQQKASLANEEAQPHKKILVPETSKTDIARKIPAAKKTNGAIELSSPVVSVPVAATSTIASPIATTSPKTTTSTTPTTKAIFDAKESSLNQPLKTSEAENHNNKTEATSEKTGNLKTQAEQIKSFFKIPKTGIKKIEVSKTDVFRSYITAGTSMALPASYFLGIALLAASSIVSVILFYSWIADFSIILWSLSIILLSAPVLALSVLLAIPFFAKNKEKSAPLMLVAKNEPRFFMLTAAVCKVIGTKPPSSITITFDGKIQGELLNDNKKTSKETKSLPGDTNLRICISFLQNLSIRQYCCLVARELGRENHEQLKRPNAITRDQLTRINNWQHKPEIASNYFKALSEKITSGKLADIINTLISIAENTEHIHQTYFGFSYQFVSNRFTTSDPIAKKYQTSVVGSEPLSLLDTKLDQLEASRFEAIDMMLEENENHRYAINLPELIEHLEIKHNTKNNTKKVIDDSIIPKDSPLNLIIDRLADYSVSLTKSFYQDSGVDLTEAQLLSIEGLLKKESRDAKIEKIASEYFGKWHHGLQVWKLPKEGVLASIDKKHVVTALNNCIGKLRYMSPDRPALIEKYYRQLKQLTEFRAAKKIHSTGIEYRAANIPDSIPKLDAEITARENQLHDINTELTHQNSSMGERIALGLLLDKEHQGTTDKLFASLTAISECAGNLNNIAADSEELQTLLNNAPRKQNQHFDLQLKKVKDSIDENCKILSRKLKKCPYGYIDNRYPALFDLLHEKLAGADSSEINKRTLQKAKISLTATATSYKIISDLAASYATRMEKQYKIESIRKM